MHMFFRTMLHMLLSRLGKPVGHYDVVRTRFLVIPTDLDILNHMNNGVYLSIMDIGRFDLIIRSGIAGILKSKGWYPVVVSETMSFRKSLEPWMRFTIETRILGYDEKAFYIEQRFVRPGEDGEPEIYAQGYVRGRFLQRGGGTVSPAEIIEAIGAVPDAVSVPDWLLEWGRDFALPPRRAAAPSTWE